MKHIRKVGVGSLWTHKEKRGLFEVTKSEFAFVTIVGIGGKETTMATRDFRKEYERTL